MTFLRYFLLIASVGVLVVAAQQSDADNSRSQRANAAINKIEEQSQENQRSGIFDNATNILKNGYDDCINLVSQSENSALNGISAAKQRVLENPMEVRQFIHEAFLEAKKYLFKAGIKAHQSLGEALALSNDGAITGLRNASESVQKAAVGLIGGMVTCEPLLGDGNPAGGNASVQLIEALRLCVGTGFDAGYGELERSHKYAIEGLKNAYNNPIQVSINDSNAASASNDSDASAAVNEINKAAEYATDDGARADLVKLVRDTLVNAFGDLAKISAVAREEVNAAKNSDADYEAAQSENSENSKSIVDDVGHVVANIYLVFGRVGQECGSPSNEQVGEAIGNVETGKAEVTAGNVIAAEVISIAERFDDDDVQDMGYEAAIASGRYGKIALFQRIVQSAETVFDFLASQDCRSNA